MSGRGLTLDIEKLLAPISADMPVGVDVRYTEVYDDIRRKRRDVEIKVNARAAANNRARLAGRAHDDLERGKELDEKLKAQIRDEAAFDPGGPSVEEAVGSIWKEAVDVLTSQSKDLQVAVWLLEAQVRLDGFQGVVDGLTLVRRLIETYWENCFPLPDPEDDEPIANRVGILEWVSVKLPVLVSSIPLNDEGETWAIADYEHATQALTDKEAKEYASEHAPERFKELIKASSLAHLESLSASLAACRTELERLEKVTDTRCVLRRQRPDGSERVEILVSFKGVTKVIDKCTPYVNGALAEKRAKEAPPDVLAGETVAETGSVEPAADGSEPARPAARRLPAGVIASREDAVSRLRIIAEYFATEGAADPTPYLLSRAVAFGPLFACGGINEVHPLTSPPTTVRTQLRSLSADGQTDELIRAAEAYQRTVEKQPWLDLQRYVVTALEQQGHAGAASAVRLQLKGLLTALPELVDAEFADGTPVANHETRQWLRESGVLESPGPVAVIRDHQPAAAASSSPDAAQPVAAVDDALALVRAKRVPEALALLQRHVSEATSGRERFLRRLDLAEVCLAAGNPALAFPVLDELAGNIERARLEDWEDRALIVRAWSALVRCCRQLDSNPEAQARGKDVFTRLCRLDISTALDLDRDNSASASRWLRR